MPCSSRSASGQPCSRRRPGAGGRRTNFDWDPLSFRTCRTDGRPGRLANQRRSPGSLWIAHRPATVSPGERSASLNPPAARCCTPAPPIIEFDQNGKFVKAFGGPGEGYEWPTTEHGVYADDKGNIWVAGNGKGDNHILKFTSTGRFLLQIGKRNQSKAATTRERVWRCQHGVFRRPTSCLWRMGIRTAG